MSISEKYKSSTEWFEYGLKSLYNIMIDNPRNPNAKDFYSIISSLFENKKMNEKTLILHAMHNVRSKLYGPFSNENTLYAIAYPIYVVLATMELFKNLRGYFEGRNEILEFLGEEEKDLDIKINNFLGGTLDTTEKKAYFYLGVLTGRLTECQKMKNGSGRAPFYSQLKGLRMHENDFKSLYSKLINKMVEYTSGDYNCYFNTKMVNSLKKICAYALASTKKWELGMDEANFIFTTGMVLNFSGPLKLTKGENKIGEEND